MGCFRHPHVENRVSHSENGRHCAVVNQGAHAHLFRLNDPGALAPDPCLSACLSDSLSACLSWRIGTRAHRIRERVSNARFPAAMGATRDQSVSLPIGRQTPDSLGVGIHERMRCVASVVSADQCRADRISRPACLCVPTSMRNDGGQDPLSAASGTGSGQPLKFCHGFRVFMSSN